MPVRLVLPLLACCLPVALSAQSATDNGSAPPPDSTVIRAIQLERRDVFDPHEKGWLARVANALHFETRAPTVRRELLFGVGEPYDSARVAESERNLRGLGVFRKVQIDSVQTDSGVVMKVLTKDGWSTRADWRFRSAGGEVEFTIGMVEDNLLGTASSASVRYRKTPDRSTVALGFRRPRLFAGRVGLALAYENRSDGRLNAVALEQPFYSLTSSNGFRFEAEDRDERVLRFFDGSADAQDTLSRRYTLVRGSAAWALRKSSEGFLRLGFQAQVRRDDFLPEGSGLSFPRSVTGAFGPYLAWNRAKFLVTHGVAGFAREEDVDLGMTVRAGVNFAPSAFGYERDGIAPLVAARVGAKIPGGFGYLEGLAGGMYSSAGLDSGVVELAATGVLKPTRGPRRHRPRRGWVDREPAPRLGVRSGTRQRPTRLPEPRLHRRPHGLRDGRVPGHRCRRLSGPHRAGHRGVRGPRRRVVRRHTPAARLGRRARVAARREPRIGYGGAAIRPGAPLRERRAGRRVGGDRGEGFRLLPGRETGALTRPRRSGSGSPRPRSRPESGAPA